MFAVSAAIVAIRWLLFDSVLFFAFLRLHFLGNQLSEPVACNRFFLLNNWDFLTGLFRRVSAEKTG